MQIALTANSGTESNHPENLAQFCAQLENNFLNGIITRAVMRDNVEIHMGVHNLLISYKIISEVGARFTPLLKRRVITLSHASEKVFSSVHIYNQKIRSAVSLGYEPEGKKFEAALEAFKPTEAPEVFYKRLAEVTRPKDRDVTPGLDYIAKKMA